MNTKAGRSYEEKYQFKEKDDIRRKRKKDFDGRSEHKKKKEFQRQRLKDHESSLEDYDY